jgi:hypothetical protein
MPNAVLSGKNGLLKCEARAQQTLFCPLENTCYAMGLPHCIVIKNTTVNVSKTLTKCTGTALAPNSEF